MLCLSLFVLCFSAESVVSLDVPYIRESFYEGGKLYDQFRFAVPGIHEFQVPDDVDRIFVKMWGSGGGSSSLGGGGGYSFGIIPVQPGENISIEVGSPSIYLLHNSLNYDPAGSRSSIFQTSLLNEIIVAGGGGGGTHSSGGAGGGLQGQSTSTINNGNPGLCGTRKVYGSGGGTQTKGGSKGTADTWSGCMSSGVDGGRNYGSRGHSTTIWQGSPGGGGYYGGGSGASTCYAHGGGGGGSGFILGSRVLNGTTITGNFAQPANINDPDRLDAGSPGQNGVVILKFSSNRSTRVTNPKTPVFFLMIIGVLFS